MVVRIILYISMIISLIVWAIIGFIIYIPMLLRMTAYFCGMVVLSIFNNIDLAKVQQRLEYTVHLYPDRFKMIIETFENRSGRSLILENVTPISWVELLEKAWTDIIWAIVFWLGPYFLFFR